VRFIFGFLTCLFILAILGFFVAWRGLFPVSAKASSPPRWEKKIAGFALDHALSKQAPLKENPLPVTEANLEKGMEIYQQSCSTCHGDVLKRSKWGTTSFYPRVPQFGKKASDMQESQIFWIEKNGIKYTGMASFEPFLTDNEMWQVAMFLRHLDTLPPKVNAQWHTPEE